MDDYFRAGKIASEARDFGLSLVREGAGISGIVEAIEHRIRERGGKMAFPVNISINDFAAHDTAGIGDNREIKRGDLVKVDVGVHINGFIADTAKTKEVGTKRYVSLIRASENALEKAVSMAKPGTELWEIGQAICGEIMAKGFNPIRNLSGHGLKRYTLHSGKNIPNYNNNDRTRLEEGEVIAIEPFATDGAGMVVDRGDPKIFSLERPSRVSRTTWNRIKDNFGLLPFSISWLGKREVFFLKAMVKEGSIRAYHPLREKTGGIVSQAEHTVIVKKRPKITTK